MVRVERNGTERERVNEILFRNVNRVYNMCPRREGVACSGNDHLHRQIESTTLCIYIYILSSISSFLQLHLKPPNGNRPFCARGPKINNPFEKDCFAYSLDTVNENGHYEKTFNAFLSMCYKIKKIIVKKK